MHLDRDDRGLANDTMYINGQRVINPINQEIVTIRHLIPGEYTVNLHYYKSDSNQPVTAEVELARINPKFEILYYGKTNLNKAGDEATVVRFQLNQDYSVSQMNTLFKSLVRVDSE